jgi:hypothetical protein
VVRSQKIKANKFRVAGGSFPGTNDIPPAGSGLDLKNHPDGARSIDYMTRILDI